MLYDTYGIVAHPTKGWSLVIVDIVPYICTYIGGKLKGPEPRALES